ncbi:hypothetical protein [Sodalis sp.]|uniref:hypothetical protein n=1 Tax=Sodalis sp. (in: enterobacteria) TaxID=1898979 RepID=UPI0038736679
MRDIQVLVSELHPELRALTLAAKEEQELYRRLMKRWRAQLLSIQDWLAAQLRSEHRATPPDSTLLIAFRLLSVAARLRHDDHRQRSAAGYAAADQMNRYSISAHRCAPGKVPTILKR